MVNKWFFIGLFLVVARSAFAQEDDSYEFSDVPDPVHLGIYADVSIPSQQFKEAIDNGTGGVGAGFNFNVLASPYGRKKYSPVMLGVDFNYLHLGRDKVSESTTAPPYKTTYNYYTVCGATRLFLKKGEGIVPFVDGMLGLKIYNTKTKIDKDAFQTIINDEQPEVIHSKNDNGLTYGVGVGFYNRRYAKDADGQTTMGKASFSLRVMYLWGDEIEYVKRGSVVIDNGTVTYDKGYTTTNMFVVQLGLYVF